MRYSGTLPDSLAEDANVLRPDALELAAYSAWYPVPADLRPFTWRLHLRIPDGWEAVTNGADAGPGVFESATAAPTSDIVVVAGPQLERHLAGGVEVILAGAQSEQATNLLDGIASALDALARWYGPLDGLTTPRIALTARGGFLYSRLPLILAPVSVLDLAPADVHVLHHEASHFWWNIAPASGVDDWLNEALAEFSAIRLTRELSGPDAAEKVIARYRAEASASHTDPAMAETDRPESFGVNKYSRGALFFLAVERHLGADRLDAVLGRWHAEHHRDHDATIASLVAAVARDHLHLADQAAAVLATPAWDGSWPE